MNNDYFSTTEILQQVKGLMQQSSAHRPPPAAKTHQAAAPEMNLEKLEAKITRLVGRAIGDFNLIAEGDRIMVAVSGGKDSWAMLHILEKLRKKAPVRFELIAVNIDQGYDGFEQNVIENYVQKKGFQFHMEYFDIKSILDEKTKPDDIPCSLCSRLRRGSLYGLAQKLRCNKIALGHHMDDFVETFLLNTFFIGKNASMAPRLVSDDGRHVVIRPLMYVAESDIREFVKLLQMPVVCCQCPLMCGESVHGDFKRRMIKQLLATLEAGIPNIKQSLLASLGNVKPSHLLDRELWNFRN